MGWVLDLNFQSVRRGTHIIYTIPLKFMLHRTISNLYETRSERRERVVNRGGGAELTAGNVWEAEPPKMMALVVCPLKTNASVY